MPATPDPKNNEKLDRDSQDDGWNGRPGGRGASGAKPPKRDRERYARAMKSMGFWVVLMLLMFLAFRLYYSGRPREAEISYTQFMTEVKNANIKAISVVEKEVHGAFVSPTTVEVPPLPPQSVTSFKLYLPAVDPNLPDKVWEHNPKADISSRPPGMNWLSVFLSWLPILLILGFWIFIMRQMQTGGNKAFSFGKSRARLLTGNRPKVTFEDVAGATEAKQELQEIIEFLKDPQKFNRLGGKIPKGALLLGAPGTGKTLLAKAVAGEAGVPFFSMSGSDFVEMFVGVGASVTGDTPILVREGGTTRLVEIGEFVDGFYQDGSEGFMTAVSGVETLGYEEKDSKFKGSSKTFIQGSAWKPVKGVYRHRASEICEIRFLGGVIRTTGDHSIFIRTRNGAKAIEARNLRAGDVLVGLPFKVRGEYSREIGTPHSVRAHAFARSAGTRSLEVVPVNEAASEAYAFAVTHQHEMSQASIAQSIGVSQMTVSNWQRGRHEPRALSGAYTDTTLPGAVPISADLMKLFGYYTAEGRENGCLEFTFGTKESDLHADVIDAMGRLFGLEPKIVHTGDNSTKITYYSAALGRFFARHCGTGSHEKRVPECLWDLPRDLFLAYLDAYARGDGYVTRDGKLSMTTVSRRLVRELTWLCAMHGIKAGVREMHMPAGRVIKSKPLPASVAWNLIIGKTSRPGAPDVAFRDQGKKPVVREVVVKPFEGYVYDLCGCENEAFFGGEKPILLHNSRVRDLFEQGKKHAPCIVFIDEIDAVGRHRGAGLGGGHDEREQTLNQLLVEMDGFNSNDGVILIAATNRPDVLDPALLRPGRFDRQIVVDMPDVLGREGILKVHTRKIPLAADVDLKRIARGTPGLAGADLANLVNEAALLAARRNHKEVMILDFEAARDKVMMGTERKSLVLTEEEKRGTAYHEAGHVIVATMLPEADPIHKVSIIPRGRALGVTALLPIDEKHKWSKSYCLSMMSMTMGGRAAEMLIFEELSTGARDDIEKATNLARKMVCEWGMSEKLGPIAYGQKEEQIFLGREIAQHRDFSEQTAVAIDTEVRRFVEGAYNRALAILTEHTSKLHALSLSLLERETLDGEEIKVVLDGRALPPRADLTPKPVEEKDKKEEEPISQAAEEKLPQPLRAPNLAPEQGAS